MPRDATDSPWFLPLSILINMTQGGEEGTTFGSFRGTTPLQTAQRDSGTILSLARAGEGFGGRGEVSGMRESNFQGGSWGTKVEVEQVLNLNQRNKLSDCIVPLIQLFTILAPSPLPSAPQQLFIEYVLQALSLLALSPCVLCPTPSSLFKPFKTWSLGIRRRSYNRS